MLEGKEFALVANQTSVIFTPDGRWVHLADSLLHAGLNLKKVFAPEHGFRGQVDAGEKVTDGTDPQTGLPVLSLYGANRKPKPEQLKGLDLVVFDIQDVGLVLSRLSGPDMSCHILKGISSPYQIAVF